MNRNYFGLTELYSRHRDDINTYIHTLITNTRKHRKRAYISYQIHTNVRRSLCLSVFFLHIRLVGVQFRMFSKTSAQRNGKNTFYFYSCVCCLNFIVIFKWISFLLCGKILKLKSLVSDFFLFENITKTIFFPSNRCGKKRKENIYKTYAHPIFQLHSLVHNGKHTMET